MQTSFFNWRSSMPNWNEIGLVVIGCKQNNSVKQHAKLDKDVLRYGLGIRCRSIQTSKLTHVHEHAQLPVHQMTEPTGSITKFQINMYPKYTNNRLVHQMFNQPLTGSNWLPHIKGCFQRSQTNWPIHQIWNSQCANNIHNWQVQYTKWWSTLTDTPNINSTRTPHAQMTGTDRPAVHQRTNQLTSKYTKWPTDRYTRGSTDRYTKGSTNRYTKTMTNRPVHQMTNRPVHQMTNRPVHQSGQSTGTQNCPMTGNWQLPPLKVVFVMITSTGTPKCPMTGNWQLPPLKVVFSMIR